MHACGKLQLVGQLQKYSLSASSMHLSLMSACRALLLLREPLGDSQMLLSYILLKRGADTYDACMGMP